MRLNLLKVTFNGEKEIRIPYETIPLLAGCYVGYNNAHGVDVGTTQQVLTYAPTALAAIITPPVILTTRYLARKQASRHFGKEHVSAIEKMFSKEIIVKETGKNALKSGIATAIGYGIGYLTGSMSK